MSGRARARGAATRRPSQRITAARTRRVLGRRGPGVGGNDREEQHAGEAPPCAPRSELSREHAPPHGQRQELRSRHFPQGQQQRCCCSTLQMMVLLCDVLNAHTQARTLKAAQPKTQVSDWTATALSHASRRSGAALSRSAASTTISAGRRAAAHAPAAAPAASASTAAAIAIANAPLRSLAHDGATPVRSTTDDHPVDDRR